MFSMNFRVRRLPLNVVFRAGPLKSVFIKFYCAICTRRLIADCSVLETHNGITAMKTRPEIRTFADPTEYRRRGCV